MAAGAALGAMCGGGVMLLAKALGARPHEMSWSDEMALVLAVTLLAAGVVTGWLSLDRRRLGRRLEPESDDPATVNEVADFRLQAIVQGLAGALLAAPVLAGPAALADRKLAAVVMIGIALGFGLQTVINVRIWRRADEFSRRLLTSVAAICFAILQGALFIWAAGERLHILPTLTSWEALNVTMLSYLVAGAAIGLVQMRRAG